MFVNLDEYFTDSVQLHGHGNNILVLIVLVDYIRGEAHRCACSWNGTWMDYTSVNDWLIDLPNEYGLSSCHLKLIIKFVESFRIQ